MLMFPFDSREGLAALAKVGAGLAQLGAGLQELVSIAQRELQQAEQKPPQLGIEQEHEMRLLWARLGPGNRRFLYEIATDFKPGEGPFSLGEVADRLGMPKGSARARLMNIGRSLKALGPQAPLLWEVEWDSNADENNYEWDFDAHRALLRLVEG